LVKVLLNVMGAWKGIVNSVVDWISTEPLTVGREKALLAS
jgi:hypothetical protein